MKNETAPTTPTARMDRTAGRWQLVFLCAVLISSSLRPSRSACHPGSPFCSAPRSVSPLGLSCLGSFPFYRFVRFSSRPLGRLILFSCRFYRYHVGACPIHDGEGSRQRDVAACGLFSLVHRFPQLIIIRPVIRLFQSRWRLIVPPPPCEPRRLFLIISSARLVSLVPIATSSHHGAEALVSVVFQASNDGMAVPRLIISSHHFIPSPSWSVSPAVSSHGVSSGISSPYTGSSTGTGRTKQASEHAKPGRETGEQDGETNGTRTARQRETEERNEDDGKQSRGRGNGNMRQSRTRTKRPSFLFARPPRRRFSSVRRPQLVPRPQGVG